VNKYVNAAERDRRIVGRGYEYEDYTPQAALHLFLHCRNCKAAKPAILILSPDVVRPSSAIEYTCSNCLPRYQRKSDALYKRHFFAWTSWRALQSRCLCKSHVAYKEYGGRGITVCQRWRGPQGFANFLSDMGDRGEDLSIDRIDVNGNYTPQNCKWSTATEQRANQRPRTPAEWKKHEEEFDAEMEALGVGF
jgi:hypothetical protein